MLGWLSFLPTLLRLFAPLADWFNTWRNKREAREVVTAEIVKAEAEATVEAATIVAEDRAVSDARKRLDDGDF